MSSSISLLENYFNDTLHDAEEVNKNTRGANKDYTFVQECDSLNQFERLLKNLHFDKVSWNKHARNCLTDCDKHVYNCKYGKFGCKKTIYFEVKIGETSGSVFVSENDHSNHLDSEVQTTVPIEVKEKIKYYRSLGQKKRNIKKNLIKEGFQPPTDNQIQHIINQYSTDHKKIAR